MSLAPDTFHEFPIPPDLFDDKGDLTIQFLQSQRHRAAVPARGRHGGALSRGRFRAEFRRAAWESFFAGWRCWRRWVWRRRVSFVPGGGVFFAGDSDHGAFQRHAGQCGVGGHDHGLQRGERASRAIRPSTWSWSRCFSGMLNVINLVKEFSPIDSLSTGRSITWAQLGLAFGADRVAARRHPRRCRHFHLQPARTGDGAGNPMSPCPPNLQMQCWSPGGGAAVRRVAGAAGI